MRKILDFMDAHWKQLSLFLLACIGGYLLLFHNLAGQTPGYSPLELNSFKAASSLKTIWENPINAPYNLLLWIPEKLGSDNLIWTRIIPALFAFISGCTFYFLLRFLFSRRISILGTLMFITSVGFLHSARVGTPAIFQLLGVILLLGIIPALIQTRTRTLVLYLTTIVLAALMYIPGMPWAILIGALVMHRKLFTYLAQTHIANRIGAILLFLVLLIPIGFAVYTSPKLGLSLFGLPQTIPTMADIINNAKDFGQDLFWKSNGPAEFMLVGSAMLNPAEIILLMLGIVAQFKKPILRRNIFIIGSLVFFCLLIIVGGQLSYSVLTPIIYFLIAGGIFYLFKRWQNIFPINPFAQIASTLVLVTLVASSLAFHFRQFYIGWPHSTHTHEVFTIDESGNYRNKP